MVLTFGPKRVTCLEVTSMVIHFVALKMTMHFVALKSFLSDLKLVLKLKEETSYRVT